MKHHIDVAVGRIGDDRFLRQGVERLRQVEGQNQAAAAELLELK